MSWTREEFGFHDMQRLLFKLAERVKAFNGLTGAEIAEMLAKAEKCTFEAGTVIVKEGNVGMHMYVIINGDARVTKHSRDSEVELARLEAADSFGEMALADRETRSATVYAHSHCVLVRLSEQAINANPEIGLKVYRNISRLLSERLRNADELLAWRL
jgi:CRP/FNR family cyclic AMP-dependent transcriptional regulator